MDGHDGVYTAVDGCWEEPEVGQQLGERRVLAGLCHKAAPGKAA